MSVGFHALDVQFLTCNTSSVTIPTAMTIDWSQYPEEYWHCYITFVGSKAYNTDGILNDLTLEELRRHIVEPWLEGRPFNVGGTIVRSASEVSRIKVVQTAQVQSYYADEWEARRGIDTTVNLRMAPFWSENSTDHTNELLFSEKPVAPVDTAESEVELGKYNVAQICENGHVVIAWLDAAPESGRKFCETCGAQTIEACKNCDADIPGTLKDTVVLSYDRPSFCGECGASYPWMQSAIDELKSLTELAEGLKEEQRAQLRAAIDDLVVDTPRTKGAVAKVKLLAPKLGKEVWEAMRGILVDVATEAAKKEMGL